MILKTFYSILENFTTHPQRARDALSDKRMTALEKMIIEGHLLVRDNKMAQACELLTGPGSPNQFIEAQRRLVLGLAHNNLTQYDQAETHLIEAIRLFSSNKWIYFDFVARINLFYVYVNKKQDSDMIRLMIQLKKFKLTAKKDIIRMLRCRLIFHSYLEEIEQANDAIEAIEELFPEMTENDATSYLVSLFLHHSKFNHVDACYGVLERMKDFRKYNISAYYNYFKSLLDHHVKKAPFYITDNEYDNFPLLYYRLKTLQKLEERNISEATIFWNKLSELYPDMYHANFSYSGDKCIFAHCLAEYQTEVKAKAKATPIKDKYDGSSIIQKLTTLFKNHKTPISKEELFEFLWGRKAQDKEDFRRLSRSIARLRQKHDLEIKMKKGCYYLEVAGKGKLAA